MEPTSVPSGLDALVALSSHAGEAAVTVRALKYGRDTALVSELADRLAAIAPAADLVTWVPSTRRHRRRRGFDPSELLARAVARRRGLPARRLLRRRDSVPQTARDRRGRSSGPTLEPVGRSRGARAPRVLLIDDVSTTGSTLEAAAVALRNWGAESVVGAVVTVVVSATWEPSATRASLG